MTMDAILKKKKKMKYYSFRNMKHFLQIVTLNYRTCTTDNDNDEKGGDTDGFGDEDDSNIS